MDETFPDTPTEEQLSEQAQEDRAIFWESQGAPVDLEMDRYYRALLMNLFIDQRLESLTTHGKDSARDQIVTKLKIMPEGFWLPGSRPETTIATAEPAKYIEKAHRTKNGNPKRAVQETYGTMASLLKRSRTKLNVLDKALINYDGTEPAADAELIKRLLESDTGFRRAYAEYFFQRECIDNNKWPIKKPKKDRLQFFDGAILAAADYAYPDRLLKLHERISQYEEARERFWTDELKKVGAIRFVQTALADPGFIPPSTFPNRSNLEQGGTIRNGQPEEVAAQAGKLVIEGSYHRAMPSEVMAANIQKYADKSSRIDTQVEQGTPLRMAELRVLGAPAIRDEEGNIIGVEVKEEKIHYPPPAGSSSRPPKDRRHLGAAGRRIADNDEKVKTERELGSGGLF